MSQILAQLTFAQTAVVAVLGGVASGGLAGVIFTRRIARVTNAIQSEFQRQNEIYFSGRKWREAALVELLGPLYMQFDRTRRAFERYSTNGSHLYLEAKVIRVGNETIRDLLLTKGHLISPDLLEDAGRLVEHYDRWLEEFDKLRNEKEPDLSQR
ncbi:MAG: hypothetical protein QOI11_1287, partial [Candidatus Eremiobacteraeota bacterium]|nr:hypothetical protein [Candidatus Eremiobacteraeota bacterium]